MKTAEDYMVEYLGEDITIKFLEEILTEHDAEIISLIDEMSDTSEIGVTAHTQYWKGYVEALTELKNKIGELK